MKTSKTAQLAVSSLIIAALAALLVPGQAVRAADIFTMAYTADPAERPGILMYHLIFREAFRRLGMELTYKVYPSTRASVMANSGQVDGEPARLPGYEEIYTNLVRVDESTATIRFVAYAVNPDIALDGWDSLRDTDYRVDYIRGLVLVEQHLSQVVKPEKLTTVSEALQGLKKLAAGRTEVFVDVPERVTLLLQSPMFKNFGIHAAGGLDETANYPYLHKRHADLIPKLAEVLRQMKAEGLFEQYMQQAQEEFAQK